MEYEKKQRTHLEDMCISLQYTFLLILIILNSNIWHFFFGGYIQGVSKLCVINDTGASGHQYESKRYNEHWSRNASVKSYRG
jgi:hypothetical protein